ncbi:MAG TPA: TonB-dependent receptor [Vicinamibacterales bacterium]|nr:TonB-dependent receptor [Vicinamibacterales bacterium]
MKALRFVIALLCVLLAIAGVSAQGATQQPPAGPQPTPPPDEPEVPVYVEAVVVTASKVEQQIVNAPATVSVVSSDTIQSSPINNFAELLREVPGMNISQTSARDYNITMRGATSTLATSQLALLDGRSLYLDFFGFIAWDLVPVNAFELKQVEVIRGPASAIWGANALNGVINFISKTPRELDSNNLTISAGGFNRNPANGQDLDTGSLYSVNLTHAQAVNDRWAYKVSAGYFTSDAFARPTGLIPNGTGTSYPAFSNQGTSQPKFTGRVDYDDSQGRFKVVVEGGYSGTDGIIHTGIGPFDMTGVNLSYGTMRYSRGTFKFNVFTNILDGNANGLLAVGTDGRPIPFAFKTQTYDVELGDVKTIGTRQVVSYGGNARRNNFDLSIAPRGNSRTEVGAYVQDEIFINDKFRWNVGARVDKFANIDNAVFSPRTALIFKPQANHAIRVSFNRAFRAPSLINNYLDTTIINQLNLGLVNPAFAGRVFNFPVAAVGNEDLVQESTSAVELAYTGVINNRATVSAAVYWTKNTDEIFFTQVGRYRATSPPPGWLNALSLLPPAQALGVLEVLPPSCLNLPAGSPCTAGGLPSEFSYRNLGEVINKGIELGVDGAVNQSLNVFANYSFQAQPDPDFDLSEVNLPPQNRVNLGFNFTQGRYTGNMSYSWVDDAFWQDVLDARFHGPTKAYSQVNGAFGLQWLGEKLITTVKVINLFNEDIQSHVFGDILKRQVIGEMRVTF